MADLTFTLKDGSTHTVPWKYDRDPTDAEARQLIQQAKQRLKDMQSGQFIYGDAARREKPKPKSGPALGATAAAAVGQFAPAKPKKDGSAFKGAKADTKLGKGFNPWAEKFDLNKEVGRAAESATPAQAKLAKAQQGRTQDYLRGAAEYVGEQITESPVTKFLADVERTANPISKLAGKKGMTGHVAGFAGAALTQPIKTGADISAIADPESTMGERLGGVGGLALDYVLPVAGAKVVGKVAKGLKEWDPVGDAFNENPVAKFLNEVEASSTRPADMSPKPGIGGQVGAKEPWEMTREEHSNGRIGAFADNPLGAANDSPDTFIASSSTGVIGGQGLTPEQKLAWANAKIDAINEELGFTRQSIKDQKANPYTVVPRINKSRLRPEQQRIRVLIEERNRIADFADQQARAVERNAKDHEWAVERALKDGKPVPPEVLADYPDLQAKYATPTDPPIAAQGQGGGKEPWEMTREEMAGNPAYRLVESSGGENKTLARRRGGITELAPEFFELAEPDKRRLLIHELGHDMVKPGEGLDRWKDVIEPFRINKDTTRYSTQSRYENPFGIRTEPEEMLADGYASLFEERSWTPDGTLRPVFKPGSPKDNLRKAIAEQALSEGKPVPPEVLADYSDLQAKYATPTDPPISAQGQGGGGESLTGETVHGVNVTRRPQRGTAIASKEPDGTIAVYPKFFEQSEAGQRSTLFHESIHGIEDAYDLDPTWDAIYRSEAGNAGGAGVTKAEGIGLSYRADEALLRGVEWYFENPEHLKAKFPKTYEFIHSRVVPENPTLASTYAKIVNANDHFEVSGPYTKSHNAFGTGPVSETQTTYVKHPDGRIAVIKRAGGARIKGKDGKSTAVPIEWSVESVTGHSAGGYGEWPNSGSFASLEEAIADAKRILTEDGGKPGTPAVSETGRSGQQVSPDLGETNRANPPQSTGIANAVQDAEAAKGSIPESPRATGTKKGDAHSQGKAAVEKGDIDPYELARDIAEGKRTFKDETEIGALIEGKRRLLQKVESARKAVDDTIAARGDTAAAAKEYSEAQDALNEFVQNVQQGKGKWSDVGRALQEGTTVDLGNFDDVLAEARRIKQSDLSKMERNTLKKEFDRVNTELQKANARLAELEAAQVIEKNRAMKRMRRTGDIAQDIQSAKKELLAAASKAGANPIVDPEIWAAFGKLVKYEIEAGASKLEDLVMLMRGHLQEAGINATDEDIKRAIGQVDKPETTPRTRPEAQQVLADLRKEARATAQIEELERNLREGKYPEKAPPRSKGDAEIEKLKAHKRLLENQLGRRIRAGQPVRPGNKVLRGVGAATGVGRMAALGADFGAILRQAMFANPIVAPRKFAAGAKSALKGIRSEADLLVLEEASQLAKAPDGTMLEPIRRRHNLSRASVMGDKEEGYIVKAADWFLQNTIGRVPGLKNVGGSLGRGQQAWLNTVRDKMFDDFYIKHPDATPKELDDWAAYINSAFGRSSSYGAKRSPGDMAQAILTSPRYEASRWEMAGNYLASPFTLGKAFKDRAARAKLLNMVGTASTVAATLKIAEISSGGEMDWDPFSSDFLKLRLEDGTVIDATAGISPRLRTLIRIGLYIQDPEAYTKYTKPTKEEASRPYKRSEIIPKEIMSGVTRPVSPGITGPIEERTGYGLSGWQEDDDEPQGWWRLAPLIVQGLKQDYSEKGPTVAARNAALEFFGLSTQRYPKPAK